MNYEESVRALVALGRELGAPRQARLEKFGLETITTLARDLGNPHCAAPSAHVAGTNGKGSTAAMLESILRSSGLRTGLYTSPHLERINERIRINGEDISDESFASCWTLVHASIESLMAAGHLAAHPTFFECVTAMAFLAFAQHDVDFAVYEVGLGGRFDATNIVLPSIAILTPIDFDHENFLGHSIEEIAAEKAGIMKAGAWVVSSAKRPEARAVISRRAKQLDLRLIEVDSAWRIEDTQVSGGCYRAAVAPSLTDRRFVIAPRLPGRFQLSNALTAATAARLLAERGFPVTDQAIERGISTVRWPGRLERLSERPTLYLDGTHNPAGARELVKFWEENFAGSRLVLVYGTMRDKAVDEIASLLFPHADQVILTESRQPRAISVALLAELTGHLAKHSIMVADPADALERAITMATPEGCVFATGSLYLVGEWRAYWRDRKPSETTATPGSSMDTPMKRRPLPDHI